MSNPRPAGQTSESTALASIISNPEATMNVVVSSSVATALLELKARYWGKNPSKEKSDQKLSECTNSLRSLPQYAAYKADIDFIIAKLNELLSSLDSVSLYFPEEKSQLTVTFPLREVLPLVWEATNDSPQFMHNYAGDKEEKEEKLTPAEKDLPNRILTFLNCLNELRTGICHHGVRNGLVLTLNHTYQGIDIIEDARATIAYFLKDKLNESFWKLYKGTAEGDKKNRLMSALFTWINTNNPREVLALVDPDKKLLEELHQLFTSHHIDPKYISLDDLVDQALNALEFECSTDIEYAVLRMINKLINSIELTKGTPREKALLSAQTWITTHCLEWKDEKFCQAVATFYSFYFAHQSLNKDKILLVLAGKGEEAGRVVQDIQDYFQQWDTQNHPPEVALKAKQDLDALNRELTRLKKDAMQPEIASFFALWESAISENNEEQIKKRYNLLLNEIFQSKVLLTDEAIQAFNRSLQEAKESGNHKELDAYEVNRFLLSAHLKKPEDWTVGFAAAFQEVLAFVKNLPEESLIPNALKKGSYPDALLEQLSYRYALYLSRQAGSQPLQQERPASWLLPLPQELQNAAEWLRISNLLDEQSRAAVYQRQAAVINRLLKQSLEQNNSFSHFTTLLKTVPNEHLVGFFKTLGPEILDTFLTRWEFRRPLFSEERALAYLEALEPPYFKSAIRQVSDLWEWERDLSSTAAINHLLKTVGIDHIKGLIKNDQDWIFVFERLTPEYQRLLIKHSDKASLESKEIAKELASVTPITSTQPTLFKPNTPKETLAEHLEIHRFLQHIILGEQKEAEEMVTNKPGLLLQKTEVTDYSGRKIKGTALQLALGADDAEMAEMLLPHFEKLEQDTTKREQLIQEQIQDQFPGGWEEKEAARAQSDSKELEKVLKAIADSTTDEDKACQDALNDFRAYLEPKGLKTTGKHFNVQLLIEAFNKYDKNYNAFGGWDSRKNNLFWRKIIGHIQRQLPACYAQAFCHGLYDLVNRGEPLRRSLEFHNKTGFFFFPLSVSSGLGHDYAWLAGGGRAGRGPRRGVGPFFGEYVKQKHQRYEILCSGLITGRRASIPTKT